MWKKEKSGVVVFIGVLMILYLASILGGILLDISFFSGGIFIQLTIVTILIVVIICVISTVRQRLKELKEEDEDDLSKY